MNTFPWSTRLGAFDSKKGKFKNGVWSASVKDRAAFAKISDKEFKTCLEGLGHDDYFRDANKPSAVFSRKTLRVTYEKPEKIKKK